MLMKMGVGLAVVESEGRNRVRIGKGYSDVVGVVDDGRVSVVEYECMDRDKGKVW